MYVTVPQYRSETARWMPPVHERMPVLFEEEDVEETKKIEELKRKQKEREKELQKVPDQSRGEVALPPATTH